VASAAFWLLIGPGAALAAPTATPNIPTSTPTVRALPTATATPVPPTAVPRPTPMGVSPTPTRPVPPASAASPTPAPVPTPATNLLAGSIGTSQAGRPLNIYQLGTGPRAVVVVGGIDGGTEGNTTALVEQLIDTLAGQPALVPPELTLLFLPAANPDGVAAGVRWLNDGVDENRNWPTADWTMDTYVSGPTFIAGGGGTAPFSEPETRDLAAFVHQVRPGMIVSYHSAAGLVMSGPAARRLGLDALYSNVVGYPAGDWTAYPVTGDFAQWAENQGVPTIEIELPDHSTTDFDDNLGAFEAVLIRMAGG
jgi:protein MpaA